MLISYTTLVAFLVMSVVAAVAMPSQNYASVAKKGVAPSCYKVSFDTQRHGEVITSINTPEVGTLKPIKVGIGYKHNTQDYANPFKVLNTMVIKPKTNSNTPDLILPGLGLENNGVLILNGGKHYRLYGDDTPYYNVNGTFNRDNHDGGDLVLTFTGGNINQIKFDTIDVGDEAGNGRINNNYFIVQTVGSSKKTMMSPAYNIDVDNKLVAHSTDVFTKGITKLTLHFSGSAALDNLQLCSIPQPTNTPPVVTNPPVTSPPVTEPPVSSPPVTTPPAKPVVCLEKDYKTIISDEFNARYSNKQKFSYSVNLSEVAKKHDVKLYSFWGWTGAENQKGSVLTNKKVQDNEYHEVQTYLRGVYSQIGRNTMYCDDLGNAKSWNDGIGELSDNGPSFQNFVLCRKGIPMDKPDTTNGTYNGVVTYTPDLLKYANSIEITTKLKDDVVKGYDACVAGANAKKCNASHYSKVVVETCKKEGTK